MFHKWNLAAVAEHDELTASPQIFKRLLTRLCNQGLLQRSKLKTGMNQ